MAPDGSPPLAVAPVLWRMWRCQMPQINYWIFSPQIRLSAQPCSSMRFLASSGCVLSSTSVQNEKTHRRTRLRAEQNAQKNLSDLGQAAGYHCHKAKEVQVATRPPAAEMMGRQPAETAVCMANKFAAWGSPGNNSQRDWQIYRQKARDG